MIRVRVPATTANLGPGFDSLGMAVAIYNHIELERISGGVLEIELDGPAATPDISRDENNLMYRAAARVFQLLGQSVRGLRMKVSIQAPLARGLGSSASAIAGGMFAANELAGKPLSLEDLSREATDMEGHPDNVVPCLVGGLTASLCLNGKILIERAVPADNVSCVFFVPDYELDTATSRGVMPKSVSMKDAVFNGSRIPFVLSRIKSGNLADLDQIMDDRLHQPYRIPLIKGYEPVAAAAATAGAAAVCISGAGPTILALCDQAQAEAVADAGSQIMRQLDIGVNTIIARPDTKGCHRER